MSKLTNDVSRVVIVNIEPDAPTRGPFLVSQRGTLPNDPLVRERGFLLTKRGDWVESAAALGKGPEMGAEVLFDQIEEVVEVFRNLPPDAVIRAVEVDREAGLAALDRIEAQGGLRLAVRDFMAHRESGQSGH